MGRGGESFRDGQTTLTTNTNIRVGDISYTGVGLFLQVVGASRLQYRPWSVQPAPLFLSFKAFNTRRKGTCVGRGGARMDLLKRVDTLPSLGAHVRCICTHTKKMLLSFRSVMRTAGAVETQAGSARALCVER